MLDAAGKPVSKPTITYASTSSNSQKKRKYIRSNLSKEEKLKQKNDLEEEKRKKKELKEKKRLEKAKLREQVYNIYIYIYNVGLLSAI